MKMLVIASDAVIDNNSRRDSQLNYTSEGLGAPAQEGDKMIAKRPEACLKLA